MRIYAVVLACALVACTPDPPDRTKTCQHFAKLLDYCFASGGDSPAELVGQCTGAFKGSPDHPVDKDTARSWARIRSLANCADRLPTTDQGCSDYRNCVKQMNDLFPHPQ